MFPFSTSKPGSHGPHDVTTWSTACRLPDRARQVAAVSLENAMLSRREGAQVLRALVAYSLDSLTEVRLWCAFRTGHNPPHPSMRCDGGGGGDCSGSVTT